MKKFMLVAAVAAGFGLIAEPSIAAPQARGRNHANHRGVQHAPARSHGGHRHAAPAHRHVAPRAAGHVHRRVVVRPRVVVPVRRPVVVPSRPFVPAIGFAASGYDACSVSYSLNGTRTVVLLDYTAAVNLVNELRALGAYTELRSGIGSYEVVYSLGGTPVRTFASHAAAHDFELRLEQLGMQATVL